jgi:hypothetical protein
MTAEKCFYGNFTSKRSGGTTNLKTFPGDRLNPTTSKKSFWGARLL